MKQLIRNAMGVKNRQMFGYHRYLLNFRRLLPSFLIIGAQKCGTTTVAGYLSSHPLVARPAIKEAQFFNMNYDRGWSYYRSCFSKGSPGQLTFEATPDYLDHPDAAQLCRKWLPNVKLIVMLREPTARAYSHFNFVQQYDHAERGLSFEQALELEDSRIQWALDAVDRDRYNSARVFSNHGYRRKGEYAKHLRGWMSCYPRKQFLFVDFERLKNNPHEALEEICSFVGIPFVTPPHLKVHNRTRYRSAEMNPTTQAILREYYAVQNDTLFELIGEPVAWF